MNMQQREVVLLVFREPVGIAVAADGEGEAAVGDETVGDDRAVIGDDDAGAIFDGFPRWRSRLRDRGNALKALDIAITTGSTVFSMAWS